MVRACALRVSAYRLAQWLESLFILLGVEVSNRQIYQDLLRIGPVHSRGLKSCNGLLILFLGRIHFAELAVSFGQKSRVFLLCYGKVSRASFRLLRFTMLLKPVL